MPCTWERRAFCSGTPGWALRDSGAALWPMSTVSSGSNKGQEHSGLYEQESSSPRKRIISLHSALRLQILYCSFGPLIHKRLTNHSMFKEGHQGAQGWSSCLVEEHGGIVQPREVAVWRHLRSTSSAYDKVIKKI